jgi:ClpX C4-type zinc finger
MRTRRLACSFCGSTADQVTRLIAGPRVFICDGCVARCNAILAEHPPGALAGAVPRSPERPAWWHRLRAWLAPLRVSAESRG